LRRAPRGDKRFNAAAIAGERSIRRHEGSKPRPRGGELPPVLRRPHQRRCRRAAPVQKHFDAPAAAGGGFAKRRCAAPAQRGKHAFDVLAGAEPVDAVIDAATGIGEAVEAADLDCVETAAPGLRAKRTEEGLRRFQLLDRDNLGRATPAAQRDLVVVGGPPAEHRRRPVQHRPRLAARPALHSRFRTQRRVRGSRIGSPQHAGTLCERRTRSMLRDMQARDAHSIVWLARR
jgi:hypothetical protein